MNTSPEEFIEDVDDAKSFFKFVALLAQDWEDSQSLQQIRPSPSFSRAALGWENTSVGHFLESISAAGLDELGRGEGFPVENPWRLFASFLLAGKYYE